MKKWIVVYAIVITASLFLGGCAAASTPTAAPTDPPQPTETPVPTAVPSPTADPNSPLVSIHAEGGMCVYGGCSRDTVILNSGSYTIKDGSGQNSSGTLSADALAQLKSAIDGADWKAINAKPFTGTCPIAFDGQEFTFTFHKADGSTEVLDSCKVDLDINTVLFKVDYGS